MEIGWATFSRVLSQSGVRAAAFKRRIYRCEGKLGSAGMANQSKRGNVVWLHCIGGNVVDDVHESEQVKQARKEAQDWAEYMEMEIQEASGTLPLQASSSTCG
jgi:hypothetical protein